MQTTFGFCFFVLQILLASHVSSAQTVIKNINGPCTLPDGAECIIPNSICNDDDPLAPTCQCDVDYVASDSLDFCHATYIGQECSNENQCNAVADGFTYCNIATGDTVGTCDCYPKYESNDANDTCLAQEVNLPCIDDIQCKSNLGATSFCQTPGPNGRCKCLDGSVESGYLDKCLVSATHVGEECEEHIQCNDLGDSSIVECHPNVIPELGSNCLCKPAQAFPNEDDTKCVKNPIFIGDQCNSPVQCNTVADGFTFCNIATGETVFGTCDCNPKYESNDASGMCLAQEVNLPCIDDIQCKSNLGATSFCQTPGPNGRCKCLDGSVESGYLDKCLVSATHVGEECEEHIQCDYLGDISVVECLPNVIPELGSNCLCKSTQAFPNEDNTKCLANPKFIADPCDSTEQCKTVADGFTYCNKVGGNTVGTCDCNPKYESNEFKDICLAQEVNLPCIDDIQCEEILGVTSYCETIGPISRCNCEQGSVASGSFDRCLVYATHVGDPCEEHFQCDYLGDDTVVECSHDDPSEDLTCRCKPGEALSSAEKDKCLLALYYDGECQDSIQCLTGNTTCRVEPDDSQFKKCLCISNFTNVEVNPGSTECFPILNEEGLGVDCSYPEQCQAGLGPSSDCTLFSNNKKYCSCTPDAKYLDHHCYIKATLGQRCLEDNECIVGVNELAECNNRSSSPTCVCNSASKEREGSCFLNKLIGDSCTSDAQCTFSIQESVCDSQSQKCSCKIGFTTDIGGTTCSGGDLSVKNMPLITLATLLFFLAKPSS